jgi:hypothetical protein
LKKEILDFIEENNFKDSPGVVEIYSDILPPQMCELVYEEANDHTGGVPMAINNN